MKRILYLTMAMALLLPSYLSAQTSSKTALPVTVIAETSFGIGEYAGIAGVIGHQVGERLFAGVGLVHYEHSVFSSSDSYSLTNAAFVDVRYAFTDWKVAPYAGAELGFGIKEGGLFTGLEAGIRTKIPGLFGKSHIWLSMCRDSVIEPASYNHVDSYSTEFWAVKLGLSF